MQLRQVKPAGPLAPRSCHRKFRKLMRKVGITFTLVTIGWVLFRTETIGDSFEYFKRMIFDFDIPSTNRRGLFFIMPLIIVDYFIREKERLDFKFFGNLELLILTLIIICVIWFYNESTGFIYFQF